MGVGMTDEATAKIDKAIEDVLDELLAACEEFPPFHSAHEGVAIIEEEFIEFRDAAYWPHKEETGDEEKEAKQLAAMVVRYLVDICMNKEAPR
jgi:hypothetical protein